ncbi:MAG TPA: hypothetical protein VMD75_12195 [Candidatus Binataceae bacterium]|nr:hypothetical protein [Candidatus Binataceae bacterium]
MPGLGLAAIILAVSILALPADRAAAYPGNGSLPTVGSLNDYVSQGQQAREPTNAPQGSYMAPGGRGFYGAPPSGSRSYANPAVMGAMVLTLWALQRYQQRHQRHHHRRAGKSYERSRRSRGLNTGNRMSSPFGYGF